MLQHTLWSPLGSLLAESFKLRLHIIIGHGRVAEPASYTLRPAMCGSTCLVTRANSLEERPRRTLNRNCRRDMRHASPGDGPQNCRHHGISGWPSTETKSSYLISLAGHLLAFQDIQRASKPCPHPKTGEARTTNRGGKEDVMQFLRDVLSGRSGGRAGS